MNFQNQHITCPDPATYAKNAIGTLGKLDSTTGYWAHEIQHFLTTLVPKWLRIKLAFVINRMGRRDYFAAQKKKKTEE